MLDLVKNTVKIVKKKEEKGKKIKRAVDRRIIVNIEI